MVARPLITTILIALTLCSCGPRKTGQPEKFSDAMPGNAAAKTIDLTIPKKKLESAALLGDTINTLRIVAVFRRGDQTSIGLPEYRLFDIRKGSAFDIIGLENADILQAANDYVIYQPEGLKTFVLQMLPTMETSSIRVVRGGVPLILNYKIVQ